MSKERKKKSLYFRYFILYSTIFLIPMFIMTFLLYRGVVNKLKQDIEDSYRSKLQYNMDTIVDTHKKINELALLMQFNSELTTSMMSGSTIDKARGIEQLKRYQSEYKEIEDIYVYYKNTEKVYSPDGMTLLHNLITHNMKFNMWTNFLDDISSHERFKTVFFPNKQIDGALSLAFIFNVKSVLPTTPDMTIVFIISNSEMANQISQQHSDAQSNIYVYTPDRKRWLSIENMVIDNNTIEEVVTCYNNEKTKKLYSYSTKSGESYSFIGLICPILNIEYISIASDSHLMRPFYNTRNSVILIVITLIVLGIAAAIAFTSNSYLPIKKLYNSVINLKQKPPSTNEIDFIQDMIHEVLTKNTDLGNRFIQQMPYIQKQALMDILKRRYSEEERLVQLAKNTQLDLDGNYCWVMVIANYMMLNLVGADENNFDIEQIVNQYLESKMKGYAFEMLNVKQIVAVISTDEKCGDIQDYKILFAKGLKKILDEELGADVIIGVGTHCSCLLQLNKSYIDALGALEYGTDTATNRGIRLTSGIIERNCSLSMYPVKLQTDYINSIKQGNTLMALDALNLMFLQINENVNDHVALKIVCFDIVNAVVKTILQTQEKEDFEEDIHSISIFTSIDDLKYRLEKLTSKFCSIIENSEKSKENAFFTDVMCFINECYTDSNMSLNMVADKFEKTNYFISRFIKSRLGFNFIDYFTRLRIKKAKQFLVETDLNLKEIASMVGYNNVQSLIINFKKFEDENPTIFRKREKSINNLTYLKKN